MPLASLAVTAFVLFCIHPIINIKEAVFFMEENIGDAAFAGKCGAVMIVVSYSECFSKRYTAFLKSTPLLFQSF